MRPINTNRYQLSYQLLLEIDDNRQKVTQICFSDWSSIININRLIGYRYLVLIVINWIPWVLFNTTQLLGSFCEYPRTNDVKQKKRKTENNSNPKINRTTNSQTKEGQCAPVPEERPQLLKWPLDFLKSPSFLISGSGGRPALGILGFRGSAIALPKKKTL